MSSSTLEASDRADSVARQRGARYSGKVDGRLVALPSGADVPAEQRLAYDRFERQVASEFFPCVAAKAAVNAGTARFGLYGELASAETTMRLAGDLTSFARDNTLHGDYTSFVTVFAPRAYDEAEFERLVWEQLQALADLDRGAHAWDPSVSDDPENAEFSFSFAGLALFVVGMHAGASRIARIAALPTLVFNPHHQFEKLRASGKWRRFSQVIRERDVAVQGSTNPNLTDFGEVSEARQYSGRAVEAEWRCPFNR